MRRSRALLILTIVFGSLLFLELGCKKKSETITDPFNTGTDTRNQIVVISDLHCGADLAYAEMNGNRTHLTHLLERIRTSINVKELVLAGDIVDEWFVPATTDTYQGKDQADFVSRVAASNKDVFDKINAIIAEKVIKVTYVPGNHDLAVTPQNINRIMPGINQARDSNLLGLGTYYPDNCPRIAIEHGHRYDIMCAPDPIANQEIAPGTVMPVGYFSTRIATLSIVEGCTHNVDSFPTVSQNPSWGEDQKLMYEYWQVAKMVLSKAPINHYFNEKIIITHVNGFTQNYSVDDILPYQTTPGGTIKANLYDNMPGYWAARCVKNNVRVTIPAAKALETLTSVDSMSNSQYFNNPSSDVRIVVFGHTHVATLQNYINHSGQKAIYVNSGTWIDKIYPPAITTMNFVVITPQGTDASSQTSVSLYNFMGEVFTEMNSSTLRW